MNADDLERMKIRDAMGRLLAGTHFRSDGKLTIKSLAAEAGVKRWVLTHKHTDLQDEFRDRIRIHGTTPDALRALTDENADLKRRLKRARTDVRRSLARTQRYARMIRVLALEKAQIEERLAQREPALVAIHSDRRP